MRFGLIVVGLLVWTLTLGFSSKINKKNAIAVVGREIITTEELETSWKKLSTSQPNLAQTRENKAKVLNQLIDRVLLEQESRKKKIKKSKLFKETVTDYKKQLAVQLLVQQEVNAKITITPEEVQQFYNQNQGRFEEIEQRRVRHILVDTQKEARQLQQQLKKGEKFATLARQKSIDKSAQNGGDLGWILPGQMIPEFDQSIFGIKRIGGMSDVVKTKLGFHIILLEDSRILPRLSIQEAAPQIQKQLYAAKQQAGLDAYLQTLRDRVEISREISKIK